MSQAGIVDIENAHPQIPTIFVTDSGTAIPLANVLDIFGTTVAAHGIPLRTTGSANVVTVQAQFASENATPDATKAGFASFNSAQFTVDANGFVTLSGGGGGAVDAIVVDAATAPGTNPVLPSAGGVVAVTGGQVAAGTTTNVIRTDSLAANTYTIQIQRSQAVVAPTVGDNGVSHFNSAQFSVDSNGFVSAAGALATTYTENSGTATPSAGNLNVFGTNAALTGYSPWTVGSGATVTVNMPGTVKWIVNATANLGTHTTIQSAVTAASSGDVVFITPGTYTENITMKAGVNLTAYQCDSSSNENGQVIINGTCTLSTVGTVTISGIQLQTNSAAFLVVSGSVGSVVNLFNCYLNILNNTGITFSSSSVSSGINIEYCEGNIGTTGIGIFAHSSAGKIIIKYTDIANTGASTTTSTVSGVGVLTAMYSRFAGPIAFSSSSTGTFDNVYTATSATNTASLAMTGTSTIQITGSGFEAGTASAITVGSGTTVSIYNSTISSTNADVITGAGTLNYSGIAFLTTGTTMNVTTQTGGVLQGGRFQAPSVGFIGELITGTGSAVNVPNNTPTNITSIVLTAGVWDISGMASFGLSGAFTLFQLYVSANSASLTGSVNGTNTCSNQITGTGQGLTATVMPQRVVSSGQTYYLVGNVNFTTGVCTTTGKISATRVG